MTIMRGLQEEGRIGIVVVEVAEDVVVVVVIMVVEVDPRQVIVPPLQL